MNASTHKSQREIAHRGRLRFSLGMLLGLVTLACVPLAIIGRQVGIVRQREAALEELESRYWASAAFDQQRWDAVSRGNLVLIRAGDPQARIGRVRRWFGDRHVNEVLLREGVPAVESPLFDLLPETTFYGQPGPDSGQ